MLDQRNLAFGNPDIDIDPVLIEFGDIGFYLDTVLALAEVDLLQLQSQLFQQSAVIDLTAGHADIEQGLFQGIIIDIGVA